MEYANLEHWPKDASGTPEAAALLCSEPDAVSGVPLLASMLESFGIPFMTGCYTGKQAGTAGVDFFVPASRLEEARALLAAPPEEDPAIF